MIMMKMMMMIMMMSSDVYFYRRDHVSTVLRQSGDPVRGPDAQLGRHASGPGRVPGVDAVVRRRADDQHVPAVGHQAQESDGDARPAAARAEGD